MSELSGNISASESLTGVAVDIPEITGALTASGGLSGSMMPPAAILGFIESSEDISGNLSMPGARDVPTYGGAYTVTPHANSQVVLETSGLKMEDDVTVLKIPYYETSNMYGSTVYIANEV